MKKNATTEVEVINDETTVSNEQQGLAVIDDKNADLLRLAETADESAFEDLSRDYWSAQASDLNKPIAFIFEGMSTFTTESGEIKPAVMLTNKDGQKLLNAEAVLASSCAKIKDVPCVIRVTYLNEIKSAKGKYKSYRVQALKSI